MKHNWKRLLSVALSLVMLLGMAVPGLAVGTSGSAKGLTWEKVELTAADRARLAAGVEGYVEKPLHEAKDLVRVSIVLDQPSTIDAGYSTMGIAQNKSAVAYRQELKANQALVTKQIMNAIGEKLDVVWNLTLVANVISANVTFDKLEAIKAVPGVKDVVLETRYEPAVVSKDADEPNMSVASDMTGGNLAWAAGYTGAGSKVAIVDTGLDTDHQLFDASALEHALEYQNVSLMTAEDVAAVWDQLNAASFISSAKDTYLNAKVPYAVNYVDADLDVTHDNDGQGEHGSHVAGIAAANRYYPVEGVDNAFGSSLKNLMTQGEAPDAQIMVMKVFGKGGGAYDSDYMAAIEDAIVLGADSVNLSLGSASAGYVTSSGYQDIMESLVNSDTVVVMSAGNSYSWAQFTTTGSALGDQYLYSDVGSYDTVGSPGSYTNTLAVASVNNDGMSGTYVSVDDQNIFYTETSGYGNAPMTSIAGEYEYVLVNGTGEDFGDIDLEGKIALCLRGSISFYVKANNAAAKGAVATIIGNNTTGTISMNLSGYEYSAPAVSITQDDFNAILAAGEKQTTEGGYEYYTGKMTVGSRIGSKIYGSDYFTMSSFSSWGVPGDLSLKPEITAPGGNIYSVDGSVPGGKGYENMSGTSMAAPQVTGLAAVLGEYIRENNLVEKTGLSKRVLTNSLLMSTAEPLKNSESGLYYPVFEQGAGLAKVNEALNATSYVLMDKSSTASAADGKVKVELGDDPDRTGSYTMSFTLNNLKDEDATYYLDADFFTQDLFAYYAVDENGKYITDAEGKRVVTEYRDTWTTLLDADVTFTVDGEELQVGDNGIDLNGDGIYNKDDAQAVLDYVTSGAALADEAAADFDHDGKITSYDAYLALQYVEKVSFTLPASGAAEVKVDVVLNNIADYDVNGTYVEGFIFAQEADSADGAIGTRHSIPVVGYYGSWSEFKSTDIGSFFEYQTGAELRAPYLATASTAARNMQAYTIRFAGDSSSYVMGGNPVTGFEEDGSYRPERNAISGVSGDTIYGYQFALNRTVAGSLTTITDQDGNELFRSEGGARYGSYYSQNQGRWYNISASETIGYMPLGLADGTVLTISHNFAPEYYLDATGNIDWDSVSSESADTFVVTVDNYAPELVDISSGYNALKHKNGLTISAHDNQYIAGMMIYNEAGWNSSNGSPLYTFGALADAQPDTARSFFLDEETLDLSNAANQHLMVIVSDYAMNMVMYKLNLNYEELAAGVTALTASTSSLKLVPNTADSVSVSAEPWGIDDTVTWSSSDESVAVIAASTSNSAIIMGVDEGTAVITATAVSNPEITAEIEVEVAYIEDEFNALVWDEDGAVWMSSINTKNVTEGGEPLYTKLTETPFEPALNTITYDLEGETLYAADFSGDFTSTLFTMDPDTFELTEIGSDPEVAFLDMIPTCTMPIAAGDDSATLMAAYGPYILAVSTETGEYVGAFDMSSYINGSYIVGLAYDYADDAFGADDYFYVLDDLGYVYYVDFWYFSWFGLYPFVDSGVQIGDAVATDHFNDLYYDADADLLFWTRFNSSDENQVDLICFDLSTSTAYNLGNFGKGVWPVTGMYQKADAVAPADPDGFRARMSIEEKEAYASTHEPAEFLTSVEKMIPVGSTNEVTFSAAANEPADKAFVQVTVTADKNLTNGLYTAQYDAENLELVSLVTAGDIDSYQDEDGVITFAFASENPILSGSTVAVLRLAQKGEVAESELLVTELELNDDEAQNEFVYVIGHFHDYGEPAWTWTESDNGYSVAATFTCVGGDDVQTLNAAVTVETTAPTCTEDGKAVYTAAVTFEGETYTDSKTIIFPATGHSYAVSWQWSNDHSMAVATITCTACDDEAVMVADVTSESTEPSCTEDGSEIYTATVNFEGETYTDVVTIVVPAHGHSMVVVDDAVVCTICGETVSEFTGLVDIDGQTYYFENGVLYTTKGMISFDGSLYFVRKEQYILKNATRYVSEELTHGFVPAQYYDFDAEGKMVIYTGFNSSGYYVEDSIPQYNKGMVLVDGDYYYINSNAKPVTNMTKYVSAEKNNDLVPVNYYDFGADGKMVIYTGFNSEGYYVEDSIIQPNKGLVLVDGDYYFINSNSKPITNTTRYVSAEKSNGLLPAGYYEFGEDGKMVIFTGIDSEDNYKENSVLQRGKGMIELDGELYYVGSNGKIVRNVTQYVRASEGNGLVSAGYYTFGEDGTLVLE